MTFTTTLVTASLLAISLPCLMAEKSDNTVLGTGTMTMPFMRHPNGLIVQDGGGVLIEWTYAGGPETKPMFYRQEPGDFLGQLMFYGKDGKGNFYFSGSNWYCLNLDGKKATLTSITRFPKGTVDLDGNPNHEDVPRAPTAQDITFHAYPPQMETALGVKDGDHGATIMLAAGGSIQLTHRKADPADLWMETNDTSRAFYLSPDRKTGTMLIHQADGGWKSEDGKALVVKDGTASLK
jgi:hypothetical protein